MSYQCDIKINLDQFCSTEQNALMKVLNTSTAVIYGSIKNKIPDSQNRLWEYTKDSV